MKIWKIIKSDSFIEKSLLGVWLIFSVSFIRWCHFYERTVATLSNQMDDRITG